MRFFPAALTSAILLMFCLGFTSCGDQDEDPAQSPVLKEGAAIPIGNGTLNTYGLIDAEGVPLEIGITFSEGALFALPTTESDSLHCYDMNNDGNITLDECVHGHEFVLEFPQEVLDATPFQFGLANWNPTGHGPAGVYDVPHFDVHFYVQSLAGRNGIGVGPGNCVPNMPPVPIDCDEYFKCLDSVPLPYRGEGFISVGAVEPLMGDHLVNLGAPEFNGSAFGQTWIYGAYEAKINFYEVMLATTYLMNDPVECFPITLPEKFHIAGYYPSEYCITRNADDRSVDVALRNFSYYNAD